MRLAVVRVLAPSSYLGLVLLIMAWIVFGGLDARYVSLYLLLFVGPLLLPLRGVLAGRDRSLVWGSLLALPYALHGGVVIWGGGDNTWLGVVEAALALTHLVSASYFVRWRAAAQHAA
jgi:uncharacterized membrane protein